jgi:hypothetical protein
MSTVRKHGTRMAMVMAASANGVGMVGVGQHFGSCRCALPGRLTCPVSFPPRLRDDTSCLDNRTATVIELALARGRTRHPRVRPLPMPGARARGGHNVSAAGNRGPLARRRPCPGFSRLERRTSGVPFRSRRAARDDLAAPGVLDTANPVSLHGDGTSGPVKRPRSRRSLPPCAPTTGLSRSPPRPAPRQRYEGNLTPLRPSRGWLGRVVERAGGHAVDRGGEQVQPDARRVPDPL